MVTLLSGPSSGVSTRLPRTFQWLTELSIPIDVMFTDHNGSRSQFPIQDPNHDLKKLCNNIKYTHNRVLLVGLDVGREKELVIRWDYIYYLIIDHPELLQHCGLSSINLTDKQDPSLVTDLSCLWKYFVKYGYPALGMYLRCTQYICEAFLDKIFAPLDRLYKAWYAKMFFVTWYNNNIDPSIYFITQQTYKDVLCCIDGLLFYLLSCYAVQTVPGVPCGDPLPRLGHKRASVRICATMSVFWPPNQPGLHYACIRFGKKQCFFHLIWRRIPLLVCTHKRSPDSVSNCTFT